MTLPRERSNAIHNARDFLRRLLDPKQTPKVPKRIRTEAYWVLRHFPSDYEMSRAAKNFAEVFGGYDDEVSGAEDRGGSPGANRVSQSKK